MALPNFVFPQPEAPEQILKIYDESIATVRALLPTLDDTAMGAKQKLDRANSRSPHPHRQGVYL